MLPMAIQPNLNVSLKPIAFPCQNFLEKASIFARPQSLSLSRLKPLNLQSHSHSTRILKLSATAAAEAAAPVTEDTLTDDNSASESPPDKEKLGVVVKPVEKPRLVLKFIWMEKNIGIGLDQLIPGHGTIPLSPYYFWPRKDAWEELKVLLESKPWISQKQIIILLNQATDIINLWQQSGGNLA
ncbi:small ribosomal subunit protein cS23-like [Corylus avellana]|uniref:small ribosomal subunit protein cS23-like n=1 Tax=Corylus avellana TaxID=13451 RepID=UPI00286B0600|nr:small ribosomal subunit protein cS23-like [Corylus avellana]XP_059452859.1 small ribosomal subunit protein cS23-like [Corylus avellana]